MKPNESKVATHYTTGRLEQAILQAMTEAGKDVAQLTAADLAAVDEFHVGGIQATKELAAQMNLRPRMQLLDIGSGVGGPARYFASEHGCAVTGIDLTEEFVTVATHLTHRVKLDHLARFLQASATALPVEPATFDGAYMIHVGMNIEDKAGVLREVKRGLKPGGFFLVFDIMRVGDGQVQYPLPWAATEETSFVAKASQYREALQAAGFRVEKERNRGEFGVQQTEQAAVSGGAARLSVLMGDKAPLMAKNILAMMRAGILAPVELWARA